MCYTLMDLLFKDCRDSIYAQNIPEYKGVGRYQNWPLFYNSDMISKKITKKIDKKYLDYSEVSVIGDYDITMEYLSICEALKIETRIICIESRINQKCILNKKIETEILGFDYIVGYYNYSILADELLYPEIILEFSHFKSKLNSNHLFENIEDIDDYVITRLNILSEGNKCVFRRIRTVKPELSGRRSGNIRTPCQ